MRRNSWLPFPLVMSVRTKIMALTGLLMALILLMVIVLVSHNMRGVIEEETRRRGITIAQLFGGMNLNHLKNYHFIPIQQNAQIAKAENDLVYIVVYSKEGVVGAHTEDSSVLNEKVTDPETLALLTLDSPLFHEITIAKKHSDSPTQVFDIVLPVYAAESPGRWATVRIGISSENMHRHLRQTQAHILQIGIVSLVLGILGSALLAARITNPLIKLKEGSLRAAGGDLASRIAVNSGDELEALADNFNFMIDQIRQHQEERIRAEKLAAVGYMVNTIVHDCRTPITVIKGFASLLNEFQMPPEKQQECLDFINFEVGRMERMLEEILQFATEKRPTLSLQEESLDEFARECCAEIKILLLHTEIQFASQIESEARVKMDKDKLRRAILNIVANAREALKGTGEIRLLTQKENGHGILMVSDTGTGMPEEVKRKIFDPFFTHGKSMGFGLGMSITKKIVDDHSGEIHLESAVGRGTTFSVWIPLVENQLLAKEASATTRA